MCRFRAGRGCGCFEAGSSGYTSSYRVPSTEYRELWETPLRQLAHRSPRRQVQKFTREWSRGTDARKLATSNPAVAFRGVCTDTPNRGGWHIGCRHSRAVIGPVMLPVPGCASWGFGECVVRTRSRPAVGSRCRADLSRKGTIDETNSACQCRRGRHVGFCGSSRRMGRLGRLWFGSLRVRRLWRPLQLGLLGRLWKLLRTAIRVSGGPPHRHGAAVRD